MGALRSFVLSCVVLLQLKGKVRFERLLKLIIQFPSLSPFFYFTMESCLHTFFLSFVLSHWLRHYLYNYVAATDR